LASRSIKNRTGTKKKNPTIGFMVTCTVALGICAFLIAGVYALGMSWLRNLPDYSQLSLYNVARMTEVYANDGTTLLAEFFLENREPVAKEDISEDLVNATISTEDERFYDHKGVDVWGVARATFVNATGSSREGASTITQQFVRATVMNEEANDITFQRKVREMYVAVKLEEIYAKDEILLMYLNTINYGQGTYGIEAAAKYYFSKSASELTLVEAATLAGIPQSPTHNNPVDNYEYCLERRNHVLERMLVNFCITPDAYRDAIEQPIELNIVKKPGDGIYMYHYFTTYIRDSLLEMYSLDEVFKGGLKVYTTIDPRVQAEAERAAREKEDTLDSDVEIAITAVDPNTGYIIAMVGGKDFYADQLNLATQAKRSCGSSFKTFTLVAALEDGISPNTSISCSARVKLGDWTPENYGGTEYGTKSIAGAFAVSSNTAFARLITVLGPERVIEVARRMGIKSDLPAVRAITLGAVDVSTHEMAGAYATIANGGIRHEVTGISHILNYDDEEVYRTNTAGERALSPEIAYAATNVMEGVVQGGTGTAAYLHNGQPVAGKTGTSENWHDSYFVGITPQISVAVWLGTRYQRQLPAWYRADDVFGDFVNSILGDEPVVPFPYADSPAYRQFSNADLKIGAGLSDDDKKKVDEQPRTNDAEKKKQQQADNAAKKAAEAAAADAARKAAAAEAARIAAEKAAADAAKKAADEKAAAEKAAAEQRKKDEEAAAAAAKQSGNG